MGTLTFAVAEAKTGKTWKHTTPLVARLPPTSLLILAGLGGALRWGVLALTLDPWLLFPAQILHAMTFGAAHLGAMYWISGRVHASRAGSAQSLLAAAVGATMGLMMMVSAWLYEGIGGSAYWAMSLISILALLMALGLRARRDLHLVP